MNTEGNFKTTGSHLQVVFDLFILLVASWIILFPRSFCLSALAVLVRSTGHLFGRSVCLSIHQSPKFLRWGVCLCVTEMATTMGRDARFRALVTTLFGPRLFLLDLPWENGVRTISLIWCSSLTNMCALASVGPFLKASSWFCVCASLDTWDDEKMEKWRADAGLSATYRFRSSDNSSDRVDYCAKTGEVFWNKGVCHRLAQKMVE